MKNMRRSLACLLLAVSLLTFTGCTSEQLEQYNNPAGEVWVTQYGECYHRQSKCGNTKLSLHVTLAQAKAQGLRPCKTCY